MRFLLLALALVATPALSAPSCSIPGLPKISGKSYHLARGMLIDAGFRPVMQTTLDDVTTRPLVALGYGETEGCAGSGAAACRFAWLTTGRQFAVITEGEAPLVRRILCD